MKRSRFISAVTLVFITACTSTTQNKLPENPKDKEVYKDQGGNSWIWNAAAAAWIMKGNNGVSYQYHPSTGHFTNSSGFRVVPPASVSGRATGHGSSGKAVFGSTGRGISVSA